MIPEAIVNFVNRQNRTHYILLPDRLCGESGQSALLTDQKRDRYYLKWGRGEEFNSKRALRIVRTLRGRGYPASEFILRGDYRRDEFTIQKPLPGRKVVTLTNQLIIGILALNDLQKGAARQLDGDWPNDIVKSLREGSPEWCLHKSLETYSAETRGILDEIRRLGDASVPKRIPATDAVHWDFSVPNLLRQRDTISGVFDWEGCRKGDRGFDLVTLAFYSLERPSTARRLLDHAHSISGARAVAFYLAHMVLRQLDWSIRHDDQVEIQRYLKIARRAMETVRDLADKQRGPS